MLYTNLGAKSVDELIAQAEKLRTAGRVQESELAFRNILQFDDKNFAAWQGLFWIAQQVDRMDEAINCLSRAYAINPASNLESKLAKLTRKYSTKERARLYRQIALLQADLGNFIAALESIRKSLRSDPKNTESLFYFGRFLLDIRFTSKIDAALRADLTNGLMTPGADKQCMVHAVISALKQEKVIGGLYQRMAQDSTDAAFDNINFSVLNDLLLVNLLHGALITEQQMEVLLTALRRFLLKKIAESNNADANVGLGCDEFLAALAAQCFGNEYVFSMTEQESIWLKSMVDRVESHSAETVPGACLAIIGAYMPLNQLLNAEDIENHSWSMPWNSLIDLQIRDLKLEDSIKKTLGVIAHVREGVSQSVRDQYEENPFPRWVDLPLLPHEDSIDAYVRKLFPATTSVACSSQDTPEILIAGCGTGLIPAMFSRQFSKARILAIDLSRSSLAYGKRKADQLGLKNIEFMQGDILALGNLERQFDLVNCFGVLHHTADIVDSWRVLCGLLKPDGLMQIGLYSKIARQSVSAVRTYIANRGYPSTLEGLRQCRQDLIGTDDPQLIPIVNSWSFYSASNFRDLAFHVHEICITISQLKQMLHELDLDFIGFELDYPESKSFYRHEYPDDPEMNSLDNWSPFENKYPNTFENCYKFWVKRKPTILDRNTTILES